MTMRFTYDEVVDIYEQKDCVLLDSEYIDSKTKMKFKCKCGNESERTLSQFKVRPYCQNCAKEKAQTTKLSYEEVCKRFEDKGCILLSSDYVHRNSKLEYKCVCGRVWEDSLKRFSIAPLCKECRINNTSSKANKRKRPKNALSLKEVKMFFEDAGCTLLASEYVNNSTPMDYVCECGRQSVITWNNFQKGRRCHDCFLRKTGSHPEDIYTYINSSQGNGCTYISGEYKNVFSPITIKCLCGREFTTNMNSFKYSGKRCMTCASEDMFKSKGEERAREFLQEVGIEFEEQFTFSDCVYQGVLFFDFAIIKQDKVVLLVEYDGIQHYESVDFFGGDKVFEETVIRDSVKNRYCLDNGIPLLRIPYWEHENIEHILFEELVSLGLIEEILKERRIS